ncbi:hypothetical protein [Streptomyces sp. NPDC050145]|uniref:hypothetical protein n=1 Tax=Streptomyces sp. NPDC050145 TaxID=3365602 RepID=UPI0037A6CD8F
MASFRTTTPHRIVLLISLNGLKADSELFEATCGRREWAILERPALVGAGEVLPLRYVVEISLDGTYQGAVRGARRQVEYVASHLLLDLAVLAADRRVSESRRRPEWRPYDAVSAQPPARIPPWLWRYGAKAVVRAGLRDKGRHVTAFTEAEALRLSRLRLPGTAPASSGVRVRRVVRKDTSEKPTELIWASRIRTSRLAYLLLITGLLAVFMTRAAYLGYMDVLVGCAVLLVGVAAWVTDFSSPQPGNCPGNAGRNTCTPGRSAGRSAECSALFWGSGVPRMAFAPYGD